MSFGFILINVFPHNVQGDKIHASVKHDLLSHFEDILYEGCSQILINFEVAHSCGSYRTTKHAYRIHFLPLTRVRFCGDLPLALTGFQPVHFREILDGNLNTAFLVGEFSLSL